MNNTWRKEIFKEKTALAYGHDHAVGNFVMIWKINPKYPLKHIENEPDDTNLIVDRDEFFGKLSESEVVRIAKQYGFKVNY